MTAKETGEFITYINYLRGKGDENRRKSRDDRLNTFMQGWLAGSGEMRKQIAGELEKFLANGEHEF